MKIYQLIAYGHRAYAIGLDGFVSIFSKDVFLSYEEAKIHEPEFLERCVTPKNEKDMHYIERSDIKIRIVELELKE